MRREPAVDLVVGPQAYHQLPELIAAARGGRAAGRDRLPRRGQVRRACRSAPRAPGATAFLTVQEGCDKFCTFCVVPYTRGAEVSRPVGAIEAEARGAGRRAACARSPCWARTSTPSRDGERRRSPAWSRRLAEIDGLARIRYTTSHPNDMDDDLIAAHARGREADALPAPAGAVGQRPGAEGDEPQPHGRRATCAWSSASAPRGPTSRSRATSSSASPARPRPTSRTTLRAGRGGRLRPGLSFNYSPRPGHAGGGAGQVAPRGEGRAAAAAAGAARPPAGRLQRRAWSAATLPVLIEKPGRLAGPDGRPLALSQGRPPRRAGRDRGHNRHRAHRRRRDATRSAASGSPPERSPPSSWPKYSRRRLPRPTARAPLPEPATPLPCPAGQAKAAP